MALIGDSAEKRAAGLLAAAFRVLVTTRFTQRVGESKVLPSTNPELRLMGSEEDEVMQASSKLRDFESQFPDPASVSRRAPEIAVVTPKGGSDMVTVAAASGGGLIIRNEGPRESRPDLTAAGRGRLTNPGLYMV